MQTSGSEETIRNPHSILLETNDLSVGYSKWKNHALYSDLNLKLRKGSLTCLMGPNGSGKSTLLKTLTGLIKPLGGSVSYMGDSHLLNKPAKRARTFSVVLTGSPQLGLLRVRELVALGRHPYTGWAGVYDQKDLDRVAWALKAVHADYLSERMVHTLSDGERQRVMIARALAQDTPIVFLDEPTAFLDLPHKIELMHIFRKLTQDCGLTLLMSTHDLELSLQYADNLWLLGEGQRCDFGSPEDLLLDGGLERVFGNSELNFDREKGVFRARNEYHTWVHLSGDPVAVKWTGNALEKMGIGIGESNEGVWEIHVNPIDDSNGYVWKHCQVGETEEFYSIGDLIHALKAVERGT